jgi:hypothetical protein
MWSDAWSCCNPDGEVFFDWWIFVDKWHCAAGFRMTKLDVISSGEKKYRTACSMMSSTATLNKDTSHLS